MRYRLSKYDPAHRDPATRAYLRDDWTSVSDIGGAFDGRVLTAAAYLDVEDRYVDAIQRFVCEYGGAVRVSDLDGPNGTCRANDLTRGALREVEDGVRRAQRQTPEVPEVAIDVARVVAAERLGADAIDALTRLGLRESLWCKLVGEGFEIFFGYDYLVGITAPRELPEAERHAVGRGLFVERVARRS